MNTPYNQNSFQQSYPVQQDSVHIKTENSIPQASTTNPAYSQASVNPSYTQTTPPYPLYSGNHYADGMQPNQQTSNSQQQQPVMQTNQQPTMQTPDIKLQKQNPNPNAILPPYIPTVRQVQFKDYPGYLLPSEEIQKMLRQNANIIRKCISDVEKGRVIDGNEYAGLHTSVYLLSLFTKSKVPKSCIPVSVYRNLINKMKQIEMYAHNKNNNHYFCLLQTYYNLVKLFLFLFSLFHIGCWLLTRTIHYL